MGALFGRKDKPRNPHYDESLGLQFCPVAPEIMQY